VTNNNGQEAFGLPKNTIRALLAIVVTITACYIWITKGQLPDQLWQATLAIWAFYFVQKALAVLFNKKRDKE